MPAMADVVNRAISPIGTNRSGRLLLVARHLADRQQQRAARHDRVRQQRRRAVILGKLSARTGDCDGRQRRHRPLPSDQTHEERGKHRASPENRDRQRPRTPPGSLSRYCASG
jgi:hypothetical protein